MYAKQNNYAFIDTQNLNQSIKRQGWVLDYERFIVYLKEKYKVTKALIFFGYLPKNEAMYQALRNYGYTIIFKPVLLFPNKPIKGNVDAELVLHTMLQYPNFNQSVIVTGDGDFYCLVDYLYKQNKLAYLLVPDSRFYSGLLKPFAPNKVQFMNSLKDKLGYKKAP